MRNIIANSLLSVGIGILIGQYVGPPQLKVSNSDYEAEILHKLDYNEARITSIEKTMTAQNKTLKNLGANQKTILDRETAIYTILRGVILNLFKEDEPIPVPETSNLVRNKA